MSWINCNSCVVFFFFPCLKTCSFRSSFSSLFFYFFNLTFFQLTVSIYVLQFHARIFFAYYVTRFFLLRRGENASEKCIILYAANCCHVRVCHENFLFSFILISLLCIYFYILFNAQHFFRHFILRKMIVIVSYSSMLLIHKIKVIASGQHINIPSHFTMYLII